LIDHKSLYFTVLKILGVNSFGFGVWCI